MRAANTQKMKSLAVVNVALKGYSLDFVNLDQDEDGVASPKKDASRRDCTINALFYNINESKVEDWTGNGLSDLRAGIIRTPIDPVQTFTNDPIKALRVFRFADRFNFEVDESIFEAASRAEIHALIEKVD